MRTHSRPSPAHAHALMSTPSPLCSQIFSRATHFTQVPRVHRAAWNYCAIYEGLARLFPQVVSRQIGSRHLSANTKTHTDRALEVDIKTHTDGVRDLRSFSDRWQQLVHKLNESQRRQAATIPETDPARVYARHARLRDLLAANGLVYRFDSHLCAAWSKGLVNLSIEEVADVMLGMRYLNEYCDDFNRVCSAIEEDIGKEVDELAVKHGGYYKGIYGDAVRRVYGHGCNSMQAVRRHLSGDWPEWPETWPWPVPVPEDAALPTSTRIEEMTDASQDDRSKKS